MYNNERKLYGNRYIHFGNGDIVKEIKDAVLVKNIVPEGFAIGISKKNIYNCLMNPFIFKAGLTMNPDKKINVYKLSDNSKSEAHEARIADSYKKFYYDKLQTSADNDNKKMLLQMQTEIYDYEKRKQNTDFNPKAVINAAVKVSEYQAPESYDNGDNDSGLPF